MPKIRGIKPETWTDEKFVELSPLARLLFIGMWNYACDNGHLEDKPTQIKMRVLPADNCDVGELLSEIASIGRITRDNGVIHIPNLTQHQRIDKRYFTTCEHCDDTPKQAPPRRKPTGDTASTRGAHDVDTSGTRVDCDGEGEGEGEGESTGGSAGKPQKGGAKRATQLPPNWEPNERHREMAIHDQLDLNLEAQQFRDNAIAKGKTFKDWDAAFRTWLTNSVKWGNNRSNNRPAQPPRVLQRADQLELPPDGLSDEEYAAWYADQRRRLA